MCIDWQISNSDGTEFNLDNVHEPVLLGYQITNVHTGRILPATDRKEVYTHAAAIRKMNAVGATFPELEIWDYTLSPMYEGDIQEFTIITDNNDIYF